MQSWIGSQSRGDLLAGDYRLVISAPGYLQETESIRINRDETTSLRVELSQFVGQSATAPATKEAPSTQVNNQTQQRSSGSGSMFKYPSFTSFTLSYSTLALTNSNFSTNIESTLGVGLYIQSFNGWLMSSFDFGFDRLTLTDAAANQFDDNDYLSVYSAGIGLMPTLPIGSFLIGVGGGLEYNQFEDYLADSYAYTNTPYWRAYASLFPKGWALGFTVDYREAYKIEGYDDKHFQPWTRTNLSLLIRL